MKIKEKVKGVVAVSVLTIVSAVVLASEFEAVFAIVILFAIAYLFVKQKEVIRSK
ncbi:MAG: hypothetical protein U9N04_05025 [Patescibacteria group bacterium]|nr:hypothetical protein [Patescibacteria group bacterium]